MYFTVLYWPQKCEISPPNPIFWIIVVQLKGHYFKKKSFEFFKLVFIFPSGKFKDYLDSPGLGEEFERNVSRTDK